MRWEANPAIPRIHHEPARALAIAIAIGVVALLWAGLGTARSAHAQLDICGCAGSPDSLGAFDTLDPDTYPPGSIRAFRSLQIPLPDDGILIFDSVNMVVPPGESFFTISFIPNEANTPVRMLVAGDGLIGPSVTVHVNGSRGTFGNNARPGRGAAPGPGGFRGGDAAYQLVNFQSDGGDGLGPAGGRAGIPGDGIAGGFATFVGAPDLEPPVGGSGGGGGGSSSDAFACAGGGGGSGAGAFVGIFNGTLTHNGLLAANGGQGGNRNAVCSGSGGAGSGGSIRLVADTLTGTGAVTALGGANASVGAGPGGKGAIRLEAFHQEIPPTATDPLATILSAPGPVTNPLNPSIAITDVNGAVVPDPPQGGFGEIDIEIAAPGAVTVDLQTTHVPVGTAVDVRVRPRIGGVAVVNNEELEAANCDATPTCTASSTFDLGSGSYTVEAQATFQPPVP